MQLRPDYPIRTERLSLRPFTPDDIDAMLVYRSRPDVCRYLPFEPQDRAAIEERLSGAAMSRSGLDGEDQALTLGAWTRADDQDGKSVLVGDVILFLRSEEHRGGEIGWVFDPRQQGKGYATEAASAVLGLALGRPSSGGLGLHRVIAQLDARNVRSAALCERLGMRREAHFVRNEWFKGEWSDLLVYAVRAEERAR